MFSLESNHSSSKLNQREVNSRRAMRKSVSTNQMISLQSRRDFFLDLLFGFSFSRCGYLGKSSGNLIEIAEDICENWQRTQENLVTQRASDLNSQNTAQRNFHFLLFFSVAARGIFTASILLRMKSLCNQSLREILGSQSSIPVTFT